MESGDLTIDDGREEDIDEIVAIERDSFPNPWSADLFHKEISLPISRLIVGRGLQEGRSFVAGYIVYWRVADEMQLHTIATRRDLRRHGIASRLLAEAVGRSRSEGARSLILEVRRSNLPAQKFYGKLGLSVKGVRTGYYTDTREDALIMATDLDKFLDNGGSSCCEKGNG